MPEAKKRNRGTRGTGGPRRDENAVKASATRESPEGKQPARPRADNAQAAENSIRPTRERSRGRASNDQETSEAAKGQAGARSASGTKGTAAPTDSGVPEEVRDRFVQVGRKYYFEGGSRAFTDRGSRLTTPSENTEVIRSLVTIAESRGWKDITVTGTERFRRDAWMAAQRAGLAVRGYRPTHFEQAMLARSMAREGRGDSTASKAYEEARNAEAVASSSRARDGMIRGRLIDHGAANFHHDPHERMSYFVRVETDRGERTVWGVDLERALRESLTSPQAGDEIGLRALRKDAVTIKAARRDADGRPTGDRELKVHRNRWVVEKQELFTARSAAAKTVRDTAVTPREAMRDHPELAGTYLYLKSAEEIAKRRIRDPEDRRRFVSTVRDALADSVARGEPLAAVRVRQRVPSVRAPDRQARESEREQAALRS